MLSRSRRLLQDLDIPPRNAAAAAAAVLALFVCVVVVRWPRSPSTTPAGSEPTVVVAKAPSPPPTLAIDPPGRRRFPSREGAGASKSGTSGGTKPAPGGAGGGWSGTAGVAVALALIGWGGVAARRYVPASGGPSGPAAMRVVGRTSLSPRHTVYLLDVGGRVLILGAGPQGAPSVLGELSDPARVASPPRSEHRPGGGDA